MSKTVHHDTATNDSSFHAADHALPFRIIFMELLARFGYDAKGDVLASVQDPLRSDYEAFLLLIDSHLANVNPADTSLSKLWAQIGSSEHAYYRLQFAKAAGHYSADMDADCRKLDQPLLELLHKQSRAGLCLSGGGIRSASFSLGVLQALAQLNNTSDSLRCIELEHQSALEEFDYLSTVSGGGYTGSWLMAWTYRLTDKGKRSSKSAFRFVARQLAGCDAHTSGDPAPRAVRHLRDYTSFLAPKLGLSLDSLTLAALIFRNLIVNWVMILPLILTFVAGLQTIHYGMFWFSGVMAKQSIRFWMLWILVWFIASGVVAGWRMPSAKMEIKTKGHLGSGFVFCVYILPLLLSSLPLVELWLNLGPTWIEQRWLVTMGMSIASFVTFLSVPVIRGCLRKQGRNTASREHRLTNYLLAGFAAAAVTSFLLAFTLQAIGAFAYKKIDPPSSKSTSSLHLRPADLKQTSPFESAGKMERDTVNAKAEAHFHLEPVVANRFVIFAFPVLWLLLIAASALFSGLLGIFEEDVDREWWARAGALMFGVLVFWLVAEGIVVYGFDIFNGLSKTLLASIASSGVFAGLVGALGGASTARGIGAAGIKSADVSWFGKLLNKYSLVLPALCAAALLMFGLVMTVVESKIAGAWDSPTDVHTHLIIFGCALVISLLFNWAININIFSLHGMYRMRLMRAFLGASNTRRMPNSFTGFDDRDNVYEKDVPFGPGVPIHLINATVNLVGTRKLAWQQRKAEGFTFSPLHSGGWRVGYVPTAHYGRKGGVSLGTAMAISGAAFNPNMGYHSSPLVTLLMTLFNVRLGWWLPNPKYKRGPIRKKLCSAIGTNDMHKFMEKKAPVLALKPLLQEAFGGTDDLSAYVELTDGGHFENLGLYEMVLRRCKHIVVVDAGADPKCQLEDLGNALRKIEIDLGIPIIFREGVRMKAGAKSHNRYCALAEIHYEYVDQADSAKPGQLLYIKAGLNGEEPPDITQYARTHPTFPHESTANQFFNEAQFESYRHLGHHEVRAILGPKKNQKEPANTRGTAVARPDQLQTDSSIQALFCLAENYLSTQG